MELEHAEAELALAEARAKVLELRSKMYNSYGNNENYTHREFIPRKMCKWDKNCTRPNCTFLHTPRTESN